MIVVMLPFELDLDEIERIAELDDVQTSESRTLTGSEGLGKRDMQLVRRLLFRRIGSERGVQAGTLIWLTSSKTIQTYPEATIVAAVSRVASGELPLEFIALRQYVETCVVAEHGSTVDRSIIDRAYEAALDHYGLRDQ